MPTKLENQSEEDENTKPLFAEDKPQSVYDEQFDKIIDRNYPEGDPEHHEPEGEEDGTKATNHKSEKSLSRDELADAEGNAESGSLGEVPKDEESQLAETEDEDIIGGGFRTEGKTRGGAGFFTRRKALIGAGVALGITGAVVAGFLGFLNVFKLDFMLQNIDAKTFSRFNASFDGRSDVYVKAYIRMRMTEVDGSTNGDNLYFRANKVDTNNPVRDWYRTMRASKFEDDLFKKQGIKFVSVVDKNGVIRAGLIQVKDTPIPFNVVGQNSNILDELTKGNVSAFNSLGIDVDKFIDTSLFGDVNGVGGNKQARKAIKDAVNANTHAYQVFQRRHLRKDIQNMTGVRSWTFFEKTREKATNKKIDIQRKIASKVLSDKTAMGKVLLCLFGENSSCPRTSDPVDPENKASGTYTGDALNEPGNEPDVGDDGKVIPGQVSGNEMANAAEQAAKDATEEVAKDSAEEVLTPGAKFVQSLASNIGGGPTKIWSWLKRIASIDNAIGGGEDSKLSLLIKNAKRVQLMSVFATYAIARDQAKSGELTMDEYSAMMGTVKGFENSEGWDVLTQSERGKASAATIEGEEIPNNVSKSEYCNPNHKKVFGEHAWFCDDQRPSSAGLAGGISDMYENTIGRIAHPIALAVNNVRRNAVTRFISDFVDNVSSAVLNPIINAILSITGLRGGIETVIGYVSTRLINLFGGGLIFDGSEPGIANLSIAGSSLTAEAATRQSGGVGETKETQAYSNQLAAKYTNEQESSRSFTDKYLSLSNYSSLASRSAVSVSDMNVRGLTNLGGIFSSIFKGLGSMFSLPAHAQDADSGTALADWAGVDKYDIPQVCMDLDPLSSTYLLDGTNADEAGITITNDKAGWDFVTNGDAFWAKVYEKFGKDQAGAERIYNCHLLDQRISGSLGNQYGYTKDGGLEDGATAATSTSSNPGSNPGNVAISSDGFAFPLQTTQSVIKSNGWCYTSQSNCHHDYNAADIFAPTGTIVVAARAGKVIKVGHSDSVGQTVQIKADDGNLYYYAHMGLNSPSEFGISAGVSVSAGQPIGRVGTNADAEGTNRHLHIDALPPSYTGRVVCKASECSGYPFINLQPVLTDVFKKLPG